MIMMRPIIEFCMSNLASGSQKALEELKKDPNLDVVEYTCLRFCGLCYDNHYALVNGDYVSGQTPEELVDNIYDYMEEHSLF